MSVLNTRIMLPDSMAYLLLILWAIAIVVYLKVTLDDIRTAVKERTVRKLKATIRDNKTSDRLADFYMAAAYGDPDDFDYWEDTAKKFMKTEIDKEDET